MSNRTASSKSPGTTSIMLTAVLLGLGALGCSSRVRHGASAVAEPAPASEHTGSEHARPHEASQMSGTSEAPQSQPAAEAQAQTAMAPSDAGPWPPTPSITIAVLPERAFIERRGSQQLVNFDFILENEATQPLVLAAIEVSVRDAKDQLVIRKFINGNGFHPGIRTIPKLDLNPGESMAVFNPFFAFDTEIELHELHYAFTFTSKDEQRALTVETVVSPLPYEPKVVLSLPMKGRLIVHDGHDFLSHHRRVDVTHPVARMFAITVNFGRYSYDLCTIDERGALYRNQGERNEDWYSFGQPVLAPGNGKIVAAVDRFPDNVHGAAPGFQPEELRQDPMRLWGNYILIDHQNGEYSLLAHLRQGSVTVKQGALVKRGDVIAAVGASGDASMPHLHYELRQGTILNSEGLPSYFMNFRRHLGTRSIDVKRGQIDSGDIVERR